MMTVLLERETETAMQIALEAILGNGKAPSQETLAQLPCGSEMAGIVNELVTTLPDGELVTRRAFGALCKKHYPWLGQLRSKPLPDGVKEPEQADPRFTKGKKDKPVLKFSSIDDIYSLPDPEYLIPKVLQTASVSLLYGVSGTGKTFTCLDMALCVAHGIYWHSRKVKQGQVWYINTEGGRALKKRLRAWYQEHPHLSPTSNFKVIPWSLDLKEHYQTLIDTLDETESPALICLDNFSMCTDVNQNLQEMVASILRRLHHIADKYGSHVMVVHHTNKEGDVNGTMAFRNHVDTMIELKKEDKEQKDSPIVFSSQKARDDEPFSPIRTELKQVTIGTDADGQPVTSCVVTDCDQPEPEKVVPQTQTQVLEILKAHGKLTCSQWIKHCSTACQMSDRSFYRVRDSLAKDGFITPLSEKVNGRSVYYILTDKGNELLG
jgi:hypothetical protein